MTREATRAGRRRKWGSAHTTWPTALRRAMRAPHHRLPIRPAHQRHPYALRIHLRHHRQHQSHQCFWQWPMTARCSFSATARRFCARRCSPPLVPAGASCEAVAGSPNDGGRDSRTCSMVRALMGLHLSISRSRAGRLHAVRRAAARYTTAARPHRPLPIASHRILIHDRSFMSDACATSESPPRVNRQNTSANMGASIDLKPMLAQSLVALWCDCHRRAVTTTNFISFYYGSFGNNWVTITCVGSVCRRVPSGRAFGCILASCISGRLEARFQGTLHRSCATRSAVCGGELSGIRIKNRSL
jgi:hypothetical protein